MFAQAIRGHREVEKYALAVGCNISRGCESYVRQSSSLELKCNKEMVFKYFETVRN